MSEITGDVYGIDVMDIEVNTTGMFKFPGGYRLVAIIDNSVDVAYVIDPKEISSIPKNILKLVINVTIAEQTDIGIKHFLLLMNKAST